METINVTIMKKKDKIQGLFEIDYGTETDPDIIILKLIYNGNILSAMNENLFEALSEIRAQLEKDNMFLACYGSSRNINQSGMLASHGTGRKAYKLYLGKKANKEDIVDIFDTGDDVDPVSLLQQEEFHREWLESI